MVSRQSIASGKKRGLLTSEELDKSWDDFQQLVVMVTCTDGRVFNARHGHKRNATIVLEFRSAEGEKYVLYFNGVSNKKGFAVRHNSKFAMLYRLALGENPVNRYSKVQQLIKHFIGYEFHVQESELKIEGNGETCHKVISCSPADVHTSIDWDKLGRLKPKPKKKSRLKRVPELEVSRKHNGNEQAINGQINGNRLEMQNSGTPCKQLVCGDKLPRNNITTRQHNSVQRNNVKSSVEKDITSKAVEGKPSVTYHSRNQGESEEAYEYRVIDMSMKGW